MLAGFSGDARRMLFRSASLCALIAALSLQVSSPGHAQQKPQTPKAAPKAQTQPSEPAQPAAPQMPPLVYSNWTKLCNQGPETGGKTLCRIGKDGRLETGMPMVGAVVMEMEGEQRRILQVMLPLGVLIPRGTRVLIDNDEQGAMVLPIITCTGGACMAQTDASADMIEKLKKGQNLYVQAYNMQQSVFTLAVPLADFAKAYDGPATDPKEIEALNNKLREQLERRGKELQQKR